MQRSAQLNKVKNNLLTHMDNTITDFSAIDPERLQQAGVLGVRLVQIERGIESPIFAHTAGGMLHGDDHAAFEAAVKKTRDAASDMNAALSRWSVGIITADVLRTLLGIGRNKVHDACAEFLHLAPRTSSTDASEMLARVALNVRAQVDDIVTRAFEMASTTARRAVEP